MKRLRAVSVGGGFSGDHFDGRVHSVFGTAANVRLNDGMILTLLTAPQGNQPRAARIDAPDGFGFQACLSEGQAAACRAGVVRFGGASIQIDLRGALCWNGDLRAMSGYGERIGTDAIRIVAEALRRHPGFVKGIGAVVLDGDRDTTPLVRVARGPVEALIESARRLDVAGAAGAAAKLVGLGPGLTPSGDDFLVGFLAGLWVTRCEDDGRGAFAAALGEAIAGMAGRSNDISRWFLLDAARGQASESIIGLIQALAAGDEVAIRAAARTALNTGSTSGADTVAGMVVAYRLSHIAYRISLIANGGCG